MDKRKFIAAGLVAFTLLYAGVVRSFATELMSPATQLGEKKLHAEVYYRHVMKQKLTLDVSQTGSFRVGNSTFSSNSASELEAEGSGNGVMSKVSFQPFDTPIQYYLVGGAGHFDLKLPSGTYSNKHATDNPGYILGGGIKYTLVPYTVVTPAVSLDISATHSRYKLTSFTSGDGRTVGAINQEFTIFEIQGAATVSKKFLFDLAGEKASVDPYLGVKVIRTRTNLDDNSAGGHYSGTKTDIAPFFGIKFKPFPYQGLVIEGSVLSELSAAVGLTLGF
ncbi:MAG: hypothetical protein A3A86_03595 [Elusimicrobia bacterium RIFCSPLOWO2_01_FULL_60_11]|nr:MAG: hypothetical protein A3A86_03595 [Elusimicrobia bacterium RIFCSPLOWO2_01_FULL_60_11]